MKAEIIGIYNGVNESSFKDEASGNDIKYRTVSLLETDGTSYTLNCGVASNVDLSVLNRFDSAIFVCNLFNGKRPKIVGIKLDSINKVGK